MGQWTHLDPRSGEDVLPEPAEHVPYQTLDRAAVQVHPATQRVIVELRNMSALCT